MRVSQAEQRFEEGKQLLSRGHAREALSFFSAAIEADNPLAGQRWQARYRSYYGLALCRSRTSPREALRTCRGAAETQPTDPEIWCNLGRVALYLKRRAEAYRAFRRGLDCHPGHEGIRRELKRMGIRRSQVVGFLDRAHPVNVILGRMRSALWLH